MANSIFDTLNGGNNQTNNIISFLPQFMNQMKGQNPDAILNNLLSSGKITQEHINQAQAKKQQMQGMFNAYKSKFGF